MSGGSYDYAYIGLHSFTETLEANLQGERKPETKAQIEARRRFIDHLRLVAQAMRSIEWVDSGDSSPVDELDAIEAVVRYGPLAQQKEENLRLQMKNADLQDRLSTIGLLASE